MPAAGHAILFGRSIAARLPDDLPAALALAVLDVCGAPALTARVVRSGSRRAGPGGRGDRRRRQERLARRSPPRAAGGAARTIGVVPVQAEADALAAAGLADAVVVADARDPVALAAAVERRRRPGRRHGRLRGRPWLRARRDPVHRRRRHGDLLLDGDLVPRGRARRRGAGRRRHDARRQRVRARPRRTLRARRAACGRQPAGPCGRSVRVAASRHDAGRRTGADCADARPCCGAVGLLAGRPARDRDARSTTAGSPGSATNGAATYADGADEVVELGGALVTPAFVDAHVHVVADRACAVGPRPLHGRSLADAWTRSLRTPRARRVTWCSSGTAGTRPPGPSTGRRPARRSTARPVGRHVYLSRVDGHSRSRLAGAGHGGPRVARAAGWDGGRPGRAGRAPRRPGRRRRLAADGQRRDALRRRSSTPRLGLGCVHEIGGAAHQPADDFAEVAGSRRRRPGCTVAVLGRAPARSTRPRAGLPRERPATWSPTARWARGPRRCATPYADRRPSGHAYLTADAGRASTCRRARERGLQAGFHAIGDAGARQRARRVRAGRGRRGRGSSVVAARHRIEHVEMLDAAAMATFAGLGVVASVQPAFDAPLGRPGRDVRRTARRTSGAAMNPYGALARRRGDARVRLGHPGHPARTRGAVRGPRSTTRPSSGCSARAAFAAHTRGGWRAAGVDDTGVLAPGAPATYAVWDTDAELAVQTPDERVAAWTTDPRAGVPVLPDLSDGVADLCADGGRRPRRVRGARVKNKLDLDPVTVRKARSLARKAGRPIVKLARPHTTVSVERAVLRLAGLDRRRLRRHPMGEPAGRHCPRRRRAGARPGAAGVGRTGPGEAEDLPVLAQKAASGSVTFRVPEGRDAVRARSASRKAVAAGIRRIDAPAARARPAGEAPRRP